MRFAVARRLLSDTDRPLSQIAAALDFSDDLLRHQLLADGLLA
jgi:hypothetical protein